MAKAFSGNRRQTTDRKCILFSGYRAFELLAWHTRRCCSSQHWLERLHALDCTYNDAITRRRHHDFLFLGGFLRIIDRIDQRLDGSGCAGMQISGEGL